MCSKYGLHSSFKSEHHLEGLCDCLKTKKNLHFDLLSLLRRNFDFDIWNDNLHDSYMLRWWGNSRSRLTAKSVNLCRVGSYSPACIPLPYFINLGIMSPHPMQWRYVPMSYWCISLARCICIGIYSDGTWEHPCMVCVNVMPCQRTNLPRYFAL